MRNRTFVWFTAVGAAVAGVYLYSRKPKTSPSGKSASDSSGAGTAAQQSSGGAKASLVDIPVVVMGADGLPVLGRPEVFFAKTELFYDRGLDEEQSGLVKGAEEGEAIDRVPSDLSNVEKLAFGLDRYKKASKTVFVRIEDAERLSDPSAKPKGGFSYYVAANPYEFLLLNGAAYYVKIA